MRQLQAIAGVLSVFFLISLSSAEPVEENIKKAARDIKKDLQRIETNVRRNLGDKSVSKKSKSGDSESAEAKEESSKKTK